MGVGAVHAVDPAQLPGDDVGELVVLGHADHRDEIDVAGAGVDLADTVEVGDGLGGLGDPVGGGVHQDDRGDHDGSLLSVIAALRAGRVRRLALLFAVGGVAPVRASPPTVRDNTW